MAAAGLGLWVATRSARPVAPQASAPARAAAASEARDEPAEAAPAPLDRSSSRNATSGESGQLERTLEAEAVLEEQGDAAREELIAIQVERLSKLVEQADAQGNTERARLMRLRIQGLKDMRAEKR